MTKTLEAGSYSTGTLRDVDMVDMFDTIAAITGCDECRTTVNYAQAIYSCITDDINFGCQRCQRNRDQLSDTIAELFDHVGECHTPEGFYFGNIEGDEADFGVFAIEERNTGDET